MNIDKSFASRQLIIKFLNEIQQELPVNLLQVEGIDIWPIIKVRLFFIASHFMQSDNNRVPNYLQKEQSNSVFSRVVKKAKTAYKYFYLTSFFSNKKTTYLTSGAWNHRVFYNGVWLNRYFVNLNENKIHFEYTATLMNENINLKESTFLAQELYFFYNRYFSKVYLIQLERNKLFKQIIDLFNLKLSHNIDYSAFNKNIMDALTWADFWQKILKRIKPKEVRLLCYYNTEMFGLCIAANKVSIPVIDMQHGGQGILHIAYNGFGVLPEGGYNCIPSHFSVWDSMSKKSLEIAQIVKNENIIQEGNPWIIFNQKNINCNHYKRKNIIVYTLQTTVVIPDFINDVIKESSDKYKWILKTHPRMTDLEIQKIKENFQDLIKESRIEINTESDLFELLIASQVHVSGFSGSIQEAGLLGIPTIINNRIGLETFNSLIVNQPNLYKYAETKEEFLNVLSSFVSQKNNLYNN